MRTQEFTELLCSMPAKQWADHFECTDYQSVSLPRVYDTFDEICAHLQWLSDEGKKVREAVVMGLDMRQHADWLVTDRERAVAYMIGRWSRRHGDCLRDVQIGSPDPCYMLAGPEKGTIKLPEPKHFMSARTWARAAVHELVHSTLPKLRPNKINALRQTNKGYAQEEVVAEAGAAVIMQALGYTINLDAVSAYLSSFAGNAGGDWPPMIQRTYDAAVELVNNGI